MGSKSETTLSRRLRAILVGDLQTLLVGNGIQAVLRFAAFVLWSQALGVKGVGLFASVQAVTRLASQVIDLGVDVGVISLGSKALGKGDLDDATRLCRAGFNLHLLLGSALLVVGLALSPLIARFYFHDPTLGVALALGFGGIVASRFADFALSVLRTFQKFRAYAVAGVVAGLAFLIAVVTLFTRGALDVVTVTGLVMVGLPVVTLLVALPALPRGVLRPGTQVATIRRVVHFGKWVYGSALAESSMRRINVLFLQTLAGPAAAGYFHAAARYASFLDLLFEPLRKYLVPKFTAIGERAELRAMLARTYKGLAWLLPLVPVAWLAAPPAILLLQGDAWAPAIVVFQILVAVRVVALLAKPLTYVLFALERPWVQTVVQGTLFFAFLGTAWAIVPQWGAAGSAGLLLVMGVMALAALVVYTRRALWVHAQPVENVG